MRCIGMTLRNPHIGKETNEPNRVLDVSKPLDVNMNRHFRNMTCADSVPEHDHEALGSDAFDSYGTCLDANEKIQSVVSRATGKDASG